MCLFFSFEYSIPQIPMQDCHYTIGYLQIQSLEVSKRDPWDWGWCCQVVHSLRFLNFVLPRRKHPTAKCVWDLCGDPLLLSCTHDGCPPVHEVIVGKVTSSSRASCRMIGFSIDTAIAHPDTQCQCKEVQFVVRTWTVSVTACRFDLHVIPSREVSDKMTVQLWQQAGTSTLRNCAWEKWCAVGVLFTPHRRLPGDKFPASEIQITHLEQSKKEKFTVHSRMKISANPSSTLITSRCLVAIVITKMKTNSLWTKESIAILYKLQVDNRIHQSLQTVDRVFVGLVALEDRFVSTFIFASLLWSHCAQWSLYTFCI